MKTTILKKALILIGSVFLCQAAGIIGSLFTAPKIPVWYEAIHKPAFTPPSFWFAPVWIFLFFLMGVSLFLVIDKKTERPKRLALIVFGIQLMLNTLWSGLFFGAQSPLAAFVEILFLWAFILAAILSFAKISRPASLLLVPYLLWVSFAAVLNYSIWRLNL